MKLELEKSLHKNVIIPFSQLNHTYYLLFLSEAEGPFFVRDTSYKVTTLIDIGEIYTQPNEKTKKIVGNIFYTKSRCYSEGSFLLAYSGIFQEQAQRSIPSNFNMELVVKERGFHVFNEKNKATLIVSPAMNSSIRQNLEI